MIAFRKRDIELAGGFNEKLQSEEYTELSLRLKGSTIKTPELTVLHLEPEDRFTLKGHLLRRFDAGYWYQALHYLYPKRAGYALPFKLLFALGIIALALVFHGYFVLAVLVLAYLIWVLWRHQLLRKGNIVEFTVGNFVHPYEKGLALIVSFLVLAMGELAGEAGKLWGVLRSPTRAGRSATPIPDDAR